MTKETMRAIVLRGAGFENLAVEEIPVPNPNPNQILAKVDCAGICTSLLKIISQGPSHPMMYDWNLKEQPAILGDEGSITLVEVGKNLQRQFNPGERYVMQPSINHTPIYRRNLYPDHGKGIAKTGAGYTLPGHLSEYILITEDVIAAESLIKVEDFSVPLAHTGIAEPLSCCISAQEHHLHLQNDSLRDRRTIIRGVLPNGVLVIVGAGMMGRMNLDISLSSAPRVVIISDFLPERREIVERLFKNRAKQSGITLITVNPDELIQALHTFSQGNGADDVIVAVGNSQVVESSQHLVARGGVLDIFGGLPRSEDSVMFHTSRIHYDEISVVGSSGGIPWDIQRAVDMITKGEIHPEVHITRVCDLADVPHVLKLMQANKLDGKAITYPSLILPEQILQSTWTKEDETRLLKKHNQKA